MVTAPPILLDCDTGIDDSLALLHLVASSRGAAPRARPVGVVCTAGNVGVEDTVRNTLAWLELAGAGDVPVSRGAAGPVAVPHPLTPETHGPHGVGYARLPEPTIAADGRTGAEAWVKLARRYPGELVAVLTGPASTLAGALDLDPELPALLRRLVVMGGTFRGHPGNTTPVAEWNVHVDPEAADRVCRAWTAARETAPRTAPVLWCGLDLTEQAVLHPDRLDALGGHGIARHLRDALRFYFEFHDSVGEGYLAHVHDPAVLELALGDRHVETIPAHLRVECDGRLTRGMTVADPGARFGGGLGAEIAIGVDGGMPAVVDRVLDSIAGLLAGR